MSNDDPKQSSICQLEELALTIIGQMKSGKERWHMPWHDGVAEPMNPVTGHVFMGRNATILWQANLARGYRTNQWATLKQWSSRRARIKRGAKGVRLFMPVAHADSYEDFLAQRRIAMEDKIKRFYWSL